MDAVRHRNKKYNQRGDTIVEILFAIAIVGVVLGLAYGITNRSFNTGRAAQERVEALKVAETQVELLKAAPENVYNSATDFCLYINSGDIVIAPSESSDLCRGFDSRYRVDIDRVNSVGVADRHTFIVNVTWDRVGGGLEESLQLVYRPEDAR